MKIYEFILRALLFGMTFVITDIYAADLMDVYEKALVNDPTFKSARAIWLANKESIGIARADLLPLLNASGSIARSRNATENNQSSIVFTPSGPVIKQGGDSTSYNNTSKYSLQLTQPIFNFGSWANVWYAQAIAKKAKASFMAAEESLLSRTAKAYFSVLQARDALSYARANKASVERLFVQAKHKFDVGLIPITDLEDARKNYDLAISTEIGSINDLNDKFEQLNEITGVRYENLDPVKANFPLLSPKPADIDQWARAAEKQNYDLISARFDTIAAREAVKIKNAGHLPTLNAVGQYDYSYVKDTGSDIFSRGKVATAGLQLAVPIFSGGKVVASARQADYQYQAKISDQEKIHRSVVSKTRQAYLGVLFSISKIRADQQAIKSAESSLRANQASYTVGTRTMADVLKAQTDLYNAQQTFSQDEYNYIIQLLTLKEQTGILDVNDLKQINSWLVKAITIENNETASVVKPTTKNVNKNKKLETKIKAKQDVAPKTTETAEIKTNPTPAIPNAISASTNTNISDMTTKNTATPPTPIAVPENTNIATPITTNSVAPITNIKTEGKVTVIGTEQVEPAVPNLSTTNK